MASLTLNSLTLPDPTSYKVTRFYREASVAMADGSIRRDQLSTTLKHKWTFAWTAINDTHKVDVQTAYGYVRDSSTTFTDHDGGSFTVVRAEEMEDLQFEYVLNPSEDLWTTSDFILIEV